MIFFITTLRALAACLITNAHYTGVYPADIIANGGLLGDVVFFAVSGYCLYNIKTSFFPWYGKRLYRIYLPVVVITLIYALLGFYDVTGSNWFFWFLFPTNYHFVASIVVLYIPFFGVMKTAWLRERIPYVMITVAMLWLIVYFVFFDRSYYHIDNVYSPMIWFLYFESMLLGAMFRKYDAQARNRASRPAFIGLAAVFCLYFASKLMFSKYRMLAPWQFINQLSIFVLLYFVFRVFAGLDGRLEALPDGVKKTITSLSEMTLEIYIVQYVIIDVLRDAAVFPLNWLLLTAMILMAAILLKTIKEGLYRFFGKVFQWLRGNAPE